MIDNFVEAIIYSAPTLYLDGVRVSIDDREGLIESLRGVDFELLRSSTGEFWVNQILPIQFCRRVSA